MFSYDASQAPRLERGPRRRSSATRPRCAGGARRRRSIPAIPPSSSTPRGRPAIRKARWWPTGATWRAPSTSCSTIPCSRSRSGRSSFCRSATCWDATSALTLPLLSGLVPHFGEDAEDLPRRSSRSRRPYSSRYRAIYRSSPRGRWSPCRAPAGPSGSSTTGAMRVGRRHVRAHWEGRASGTGRLAYALARAVAFRPLLNKLGFDALELVISGGAPLPPETMALWQMWGVNVCEIYGQTEEAGAIITGQRERFPRPGDVGTLAPGWKLKLAARRDPDPRRARVRELLGTSRRRARCSARTAGCTPATSANGRTAAPADRSRARLHRHRGRQDAVASSSRTRCAPAPTSPRWWCSARPQVPDGAGRDRLRCRRRLGAAHDIAYTGFTSLAEHPAVEALIGAEMARANTAGARRAGQGFRILPKALDPEEEGEPVTPTRKVKRAQCMQRFATWWSRCTATREERLLARRRATCRPSIRDQS